jgi:hypothetical protein
MIQDARSHEIKIKKVSTQLSSATCFGYKGHLQAEYKIIYEIYILQCRDCYGRDLVLHRMEVL